MLQTPNHIAIIMDGNGRWAESKGKQRYHGHRVGAENIFKIASHCNEVGVKYLTLYAFSTENWSRPVSEVNFLVKDLPFIIYQDFNKKLKKNNIRLRIAGRKSKIPQKTLDLFADLEQQSIDNDGLQIILAFNYGGKSEIVDACKSIMNSEKHLEIDEDLFRKYLYLPDVPDVDLLIRTGKEHRLSNFLLWQLSYAEILFEDKYWPEYSNTDIDRALEDYRNRKRRFGKV